MDLPSTQPFPMPLTELRKLVRRVTVMPTNGIKVVIDTLAHVNRQVQLGPVWDNPVREFVIGGVRFKQRGQTEFDILVQKVPESEPHNAWDVLHVSEDGTQAAIT